MESTVSKGIFYKRRLDDLKGRQNDGLLKNLKERTLQVWPQSLVVSPLTCLHFLRVEAFICTLRESYCNYNQRHSRISLAITSYDL